MLIKRLLSSLCICLFVLGIYAQPIDKTCYFGFTYEVSQNPRWGFGEPVVTSVDPNSNAAKAGLKVGDIIMEINRKATYLRHYELLSSWLFDDTSRSVSFTIRNLNNSFKEIFISRYCRGVDGVTEEELADWFSLYNVQGNNKQSFVLPLVVSAHPDVDFSNYYTYNFVFKNKKTSELDDYIIHQIERNLNQKGLSRDTKDPDILIQFYYSYSPNQNYVPNEVAEETVGEWRFDASLNKMEKVPVAPRTDNINSSYIKGRIEFGFQFFENKYITEGKNTQIFDAHMTEYVVGNYSLESYCQIHLPLMLAVYPYQTPAEQVKYLVDFKEFYYTGLVFNRNDLKVIENVDDDSPAYKAGIRTGDEVLSVNNIPFGMNYYDTKSAYAAFMGATMQLRNSTAGFFNEQVGDFSYPWDDKKSGKISKEFRNKKYATGFSYLFSFGRFINSKPPRQLSFLIKRRGVIFIFYVTPEYRKSANLSNVNIDKN